VGLVAAPALSSRVTRAHSGYTDGVDVGFQYRFLALLGEGGSARVYKAQQVSREGVARDVALKVLTEEHPAPDVLARWSAEAAILGWVRDRAVVAVEPPMRLGDHFVMVMEHADGVTLRALLSQGPLPAGVATEVVGEIARALHGISQTCGPDGQPLEIVHRDIKPDNLQLTPAGDVRLLDFGNARALLPGLSAPATLAGTPGYIAPERARGDDGPAGDVYALGVVLHEAVTGHRPLRPPVGEGPDPRDAPEGASEDQLEVLRLAALLRAQDPAARPVAREVERACRALRRRMSGEYLQEWAALQVPAHPGELSHSLPPDPWVGRVYPEPARPLSPWPWALWSWALVGLGLCVLLLPLLWGLGPTSTVSPEQPAPAQLSLAPEPDESQPVEVISAPVPVLEPAPALPVLELPVPRARARPVAPEIVPSVVPPQPEPTPRKGVTYRVLIVSIPFGAEVELVSTGEKLGQTPLGHQFPAGNHAIRLVAADGTTTETTIAVGRSMPVRYVWKSAEGRWESGY
jgi:serine/threonine protein kinase